MSKPLEGIRVVDLSTFVAAPCAGRLLADLGAEVIKVEKPEGDAWRRSGVGYLPHVFDIEKENPVFDIYNTGKKFVSINLKSEEGMEAFHKLLASADVFITNNREKALKKLGLSYDDLKDKYPRLIFAQVTGFGPKGPDADDPAYDTTSFWARGGFMRDQAVISEDGEYHPVMPPSSVGDTVTAYVLDMEILSAIIQRNTTGKGQKVESGLYHNGIFVFGTMQIISQRPFGRTYPYSRVDHGCPAGWYKCADGEYIYVGGAIASKDYALFTKIMELPDLFERPEFETGSLRWKNRAALYKILADKFAEHPVQWWLDRAKSFGTAFTRFTSYADIPEDPQALANGYVEHVTYANGHEEYVPRSPLHMTGIEEELHQLSCPGVGSDNAAVLKTVGYTDEEIEALKADGAIAEA